MYLHTSVPNTLTINDCVLHLSYFIGQIDLITNMLKIDDRRVGILYNYNTNMLIMVQENDFRQALSHEELMIVDMALLLEFNVKLIAARMYGCYVSNSRHKSYLEAPTMIVDYRFDR